MGYLSWGTKKGRRPASGDSQRKNPATLVAAAAASGGGCINAVLHMFDFQRFNLCLHPQLDNHDYPPPSKGVEAPRNSLEAAEEIVIGPPSLVSVVGNQKDYIPVGIEINTSRRDTRLKLVQAPREDMTTSESSNSPARTPCLVARLMGLDILPESVGSTTTTPRSSSVNTAPPKKGSLLETPRRLSLQINKEDSIVREMESSRPSCSAINTKAKTGRSMLNNYEEGESRSPGYYARQIMKQVKETVSRRSSSFGVDITNNINNNNNKGQKSDLSRRDEHLLTVSTKPRKHNKLKNSEPGSRLNSLSTEAPTMAVKPPPKPLEDEKKILGADKSALMMKKKMKKNPPKSYDSSIKNKKDEQFVRPPLMNKSKKTPLSSDLFYGSVPSLVLQKQGSSSKAQLSKPIMSQSTTTNTNASTGNGAQLSRTPNQQRCDRFTQIDQATHVPAVQATNRSKETNSITEFQYISRILKCTGIDRDTPVTLAKWFSTSHPLNPSIFHNLEAAHYVDQRPCLGNSNRRLIFNLVDEIVADLLKPYVMPKSRVFGTLRQCSYNEHQQMIYGFQLVKILCTRIRSIPSADCQTLQDIDALVEKDLPRTGVQGDLVALEKEGDDIVSEIQRDILDSLVREIAVFCLGSRRSRSSCYRGMLS